ISPVISSGMYTLGMEDRNIGEPRFGASIRETALDWLIIVASAVFIYLMVFKLPATPIVAESDSLIFLYEAGRILHGDVIYRDFFEFTFPGTQTLYALI